VGVQATPQRDKTAGVWRWPHTHTWYRG
jgi:hypothetical protein